MAVGRIILGVLGGLLVAGIMIALVEAVGHMLGAGQAAFVAAVAGYGIGAFAGTAVTSRVAGRRTAIVIPLLLAGLAAMNLMSFAHPVWFAPAAAAMLALGWWLGSSLIRSGREADRR